MRAAGILGALAALILAAAASAAEWRIDPRTRVAVDVPWSGGVAEVRFPDLAGTVAFDEARPEAARARIAVSARTATTGLAPVDALLRSRDYLDAAAHPQVVFDLDRLVRTSSSTADVFGRITLRGVTREVAFEARVIRYGPGEDGRGFEAGFDIEGAIDRTEFGSRGGLPDIGAVLPVRVRLVMVRD